MQRTLQNMFYGHLKCSILTGLLLFMMNNSPTTGSVTTTVAEKQRLASLVLLSIVRRKSLATLKQYSAIFLTVLLLFPSSSVSLLPLSATSIPLSVPLLHL